MDPLRLAAALPRDSSRLARSFAAWPKPPSLFDHYLSRQSAGALELLLVDIDDDVAGYCVLVWEPTYPPFLDRGIPEIADLNVLPDKRGLGAGRRLMEFAEGRAATRSSMVGLRVGLYSDYGPAQIMYAKRGYVPDGRGVSIDGTVVPPGASLVLDDSPVLGLLKSLA